MIEPDCFGGTCLNRGCIPSKMLVVAADAARAVTEGKRLGVHAPLDRVDWRSIRDRIFDRIDPLHDRLQTAISWLSGSRIEQYMSAHQHDPNANELWSHFQAVISWVQLTFTTYRKEMKGLDWGSLYNQFKDGLYDTTKLEDEIKALMVDDDVTIKKGHLPLCPHPRREVLVDP